MRADLQKANDTLASIGRTTGILGIAATAAAGLLWSGPGMIAAALGAVIGLGNFVVIRWLAARAIAAAAGGEPVGVPLVVGLVFKLPLLLGLVALLVWGLHVPAGPFALGLSALVAALLIGGLRSAMSAPTGDFAP